METVFLALRVVVALGAVFGALLFAHRWITKGRPGQARAKQIAIVARQGLGAKAGIAIVDAHGRRYLLGVTEHTVTVLDTLGPADAPAGAVEIVATAPVQVQGDGFEQRLQTVDLATGALPVLISGDPKRPATMSISLPPMTRRAIREAEAKQAASGTPQASPIAGSVLSPTTWRQTVSAIKQLR